MSGTRPPALARLALQLALAKSVREFILGDLQEEFSTIVAEAGIAPARKWYWRQALATAVRGPRGPLGRNTPGGGRVPLLDSLWQDIRFAARSFRQRPLFAAAAVVTLALGIGATTAVFGFANALLFRPLPGIRDPGHIGVIWFGRRSPSGGISVSRVSYPNLADLNARLTGFGQLAGFQYGGAYVAVADADPESMDAQFVTPSYFSVLGVSAIRGRTFTPREDDPVHGGAAVAVISHRLWMRMFGGRDDVLGRTITVNGLPFDIIGVLPRGFHGTQRSGETDLWFPGTTDAYVSHLPVVPSTYYADRSRGGFFEFVARLQPGATWERAEAEVRAASTRLAELYPGVNDKFTEVGPIPARGAGMTPFGRGGAVSTLKLLFGVVALILLIACANVANLLLVRGVLRRGERAVRTALGATRGRLVRQHLTENLVLWLTGGALGLGVAWCLIRLLQGTRVMSFTVKDVTIDWRVAGFTLVASLVTGLVFGTLPALFAPKVQLAASLKDAARSETGGRTLLRSGLTALQIAATLALLVGAFLFVRTLRELSRIELGFDPHGVSAAEVVARYQGYSEEAAAAYFRSFVERLQATPGITVAAASDGPPFVSSAFLLRVRSANATDDREPLEVRSVGATAGFRDVLGAPLLRGRWFTAGEVLPASGRAGGVAVLTQSLARALFGDGDPIGQSLRFPVLGRNDPSDVVQVVGVMSDMRWGSLDGPIEPIVFEPLGQNRPLTMGVYVLARTATGESALPIMKQVARQLDRTLPIVRPTTLDQAIHGQASSRRMFARLLTLVSVLGIVLAAVGLYAVVAFAVAARTREFGVRIAIGADAQSILRLVLRRGLIVVGLGVASGLAGAFVISKLVESRLYGVRALDPVSYVVATVVLVVVALLATLIPARRATRVDPIAALRCE